MCNSVLVIYDGTSRAERTLSYAVEHCQRVHGRLGIAVVPPWYALASSPWAGAVLIHTRAAARREALRSVPDDVPVRFVASNYPLGPRDVPGLAQRLGCDLALLPFGGLRRRRAERLLAKAGVGVLSDGERRRKRILPGARQKLAGRALEHDPAAV